MGFKLGAFLGGVAKGATELIEEREKENALQIKESIKNMYHNYAEYKKETDKKKTEMRDVVGSLRSFKFSDGPLDEKELIALASDIPTSKAIAEQLTKNPEKFVGLSKSFIKAKDKVPEGMTFSDYVDQYGKTAKMSSEQLAAAVGTRDEGFLNKLVYGENLNKIKAAAAKYGVTAEELYSAGAGRDSKSLPSLLEVDYSKLKEKPDFKKIESDAQVAAYEADKTGTDEDKLNAAKNLARIALIKSTPPKDLTQAQTENNYANEIIKLRKAGKKEEAAEKEADLNQWKKLVANPLPAAKTDADKISAANLLVTASRTMEATFKTYLPQPGAFTTTTDREGNVTLQVSALVLPEQSAKAYTAGREVLIKEMTVNGKPIDRMHKNALMSAGVQFDQDGNAINPQIQYGSGAPPTQAAPVAPPTRSVRGGPMAPKPKPDSAAPAMPARFNTPNVAPVDKATARAQANAAIANKAPADLVAKRFKETYGEDL
jgi:hypothetical protein